MERAILGIVAVLILAGCGTNGVSYRDKILAANEAMESSMRAGDLRAVAAMYTDDGVLHGPSGDRVQGRDAIDAYWERFDRAIDWELTTDALSVCADRAWQEGSSTITFRSDDGSTVEGRVDFYLLWRKQSDGAWRIALDAWWDPDAGYVDAIRRVLDEDDRLGEIRDRGVEERPIHEVVREYGEALGSMDMGGCPGDFREAYHRHTLAWEAMVGVLEPYARLRGEMHDVLDELTVDGASSRDRVQDGLDAVWSTWGEVEDSVVRHGAQEKETQR
ncbi:MAG: YybH family protein [Planctomycetota bacterium]|jgi:uncharacterized protein (TIGR02246 family)